ncbi:PQQ-dependent sugar dehydrogenase [Croceibacter atlanticus]|uniref:PQQ-dependent sugar dehydrogenase n=1 Tax=Croceibacter atlanticus TaxID=313588 RepID=UPI002357DE98|nr:PQQ-dependent sugar dehydrogenase [Croceibacter atlanticus]|tara:strand:- start:10409 stop:11587 length:1179 start_codon:yes stop_codon:yes gene_type:complete
MKLFKLLLSVLILSNFSSCKNEEKSSEDTAQTTTTNEQTIPQETLDLVDNTSYTTELVVDGIDIPWGIDFLPDESMLVTEKSGTLYHIVNGKKTAIKNVPAVYNRGQGGLLDIKVHPDFKNNNFIFITYASEEGEGKGGNTALIRAELKNNALENIKTLYKATPNTTRGQHFGSRIVINDQGFIFFTIGERGNRDENPQDITRDGGKLYRLHIDGSVPKDNPFVGKEKAKEAIWSYGHRNPQGMEINPETNTIWLHEHGPKGGDEINIPKKGLNYGWPSITYGKNYSGTTITKDTSKPGMEQPVFYWVPSIAPSGMSFVTSDKYPNLKGNLLSGSLKFQYLEHNILDGENVTKRERLLKDIGRVRSVEEGPDGFIYIGVESKGILKLVAKQQ